MSKEKFSSVYNIYKLALDIVGEKAGSFKKSILFFSISYVAKGLAFGMFYPLLKSMFADIFIAKEVFTFLGLMVVFTLISLSAKWKALDFDYKGEVVEVAHSLRTKLGNRLRKMPLETLSNYKTGDLNSILSSNVDESGGIMGTIASLVLKLILLPLTIVVVTLFTDPRLAGLMIVIFPLLIPLYYWTRKISLVEKRIFKQASADLEAGFIEYIQGLPVLRAVNKTGANAQKLQDSIKQVRIIQRRELYKTQTPLALIGILVEAILMIILLSGYYFISNDSLAVVTLGAAIVIITRLTEPLSIFASVIKVFDSIDSAFKRIKSVLEIKPLDIYKPVKTPESFDVEFNSVDFTYQNQRSKTISDVSFYLPNKSMTAIVGDSGCGKTTLTRLIMRYADADQGAVKIGGTDIKNMDPDDLMKHISVVFQDVYLFDDTIINNIRMAKPGAANDAVEAAADSAYCHEFISRLPDGYNTKVGDIGGSLSGGERQRISIARAILKDAPVVILDEPTAALDTESEVAVQHAIDKLVEDKTVVVIAHRLSTIAGADNILVVDKGRIIESGKHGELIGKKGKYFRMWSSQKRVKDWQIHT